MKIFTLLFFLFPACIIAECQTTCMVTMRDSIHLATSIYLPPDTANGTVPIVLTRTPYGRGPAGVFMDSLFAHGIGYASQDTRGRGDSEGLDSLFFDNGWGQRRDGYDAVEWLAQQPWCNGKIGLWGGSAYGITAYLCAAANPPHLVCGLVACAASDMYKHAAYPGGCYRKEQVDNWFVLEGLSHMRDLFVQHYIYDEIWDGLNIFTRLDSITVPFYHIGGWYDTFCEGTVDAFSNLQNSGGIGAQGKQKMLIGPWCHGAWNSTAQGDLYYPQNSLWQIEPLSALWFNHYLKNEPNGIEDTSAVRVYIMGGTNDTLEGNYWKEFSQWPPLQTYKDSLFLNFDHTIEDIPYSQDTFLTYYHDPGGPMLHNGGRNLLISPGPKDQLFQDISPHGVIFTSLVFSQPLIITGKVAARIFASSDCIDTDFMVRLEDVYPNGHSYLIYDGALQARFREGTDHEIFMTPGNIYELEIVMGNIAYSFNTGHKIRVGISSALSSRYEPNPNTGEPFRQNTYTLVAHNKVYSGPSYPSSIIFDAYSDTITIGVPELSSNKKDDIFIYPNPASESITVSIPQEISQENMVAEIYSIQGALIRKHEGFINTSISTSDIPQGIYLLKIMSNKNVFCKKFEIIK